MTTNELMTGEELGEKLLASVKQMKAGLGATVYCPQSDSAECVPILVNTKA